MKTTQGIIKILPFEEKFKQKLLQDFDRFTPDQRFDIERLVWNCYYSLYQIYLDANIQLAFSRAEQNKEKLDKEFYKRVREQTERELERKFSQIEENQDLSETRKSLEAVIKQPSH